MLRRLVGRKPRNCRRGGQVGEAGQGGGRVGKGKWQVGGGTWLHPPPHLHLSKRGLTELPWKPPGAMYEAHELRYELVMVPASDKALTSAIPNT